MQKPLPTATGTGLAQGQAQTIGAMPTQPLPSPTPNTPGGQTQAALVLPGTSTQGQVATGVTTPVEADPGQNLRGWYPRWWLLSALFCCPLIYVMTLLQPTFCASNASTLPCQAVNWNDWRQIFIVGSIWLLFLVGWVIAHVVGVVKIEVDQRSRDRIAQVIYNISEFRTLYPLLSIAALVAFWVIVFMWYFNRFQILGFSACSLVIFVGTSGFMYQSTLEERRQWALGIAALFILFIGAMFLLRRIQTVLLIVEIFVVLMGLVYFFRAGARAQAQQTTTQQVQIAGSQTPVTVQQLAQQQANKLTYLEVFISLLKSLYL